MALFSLEMKASVLLAVLQFSLVLALPMPMPQTFWRALAVKANEAANTLTALASRHSTEFNAESLQQLAADTRALADRSLLPNAIRVPVAKPPTIGIGQVVTAQRPFSASEIYGMGRPPLPIKPEPLWSSQLTDWWNSARRSTKNPTSRVESATQAHPLINIPIAPENVQPIVDFIPPPTPPLELELKASSKMGKEGITNDHHASLLRNPDEGTLVRSLPKSDLNTVPVDAKNMNNLRPEVAVLPSEATSSSALALSQGTNERQAASKSSDFSVVSAGTDRMSNRIEAKVTEMFDSKNLDAILKYMATIKEIKFEHPVAASEYQRILFKVATKNRDIVDQLINSQASNAAQIADRASISVNSVTVPLLKAPEISNLATDVGGVKHTFAEKSGDLHGSIASFPRVKSPFTDTVASKSGFVPLNADTSIIASAEAPSDLKNLLTAEESPLSFAEIHNEAEAVIDGTNPGFSSD